MWNHFTFNYYHIKVVIDEYDYIYIDIYPHYKIKDVKDIINKRQGKITPEYVQVYKGEILLDDNRTVESYNITQKNTLSIKSSRTEEFLVYFWSKERTVGKYVTKEDNIYEAFNWVKFKFKDYSVSNYDPTLIYSSYAIHNQEKYTFESLNIKENSKIIVTIPFDQPIWG